jgi:uncharacterized membrane protein YeiB
MAAAAPGLATGEAGAEPTRASRLLGVDVARSMAILGMLVAHYARPDENGWAGPSDFVNGKAMPLFVLLGGVGLTLLTDRARHPARAVLGRAALLAVLGLLLVEHVPLIAVILHFYAAYFVLGLLVRCLPDVGLLAVAVAVTAAGAVTWMALAPDLPTYGGWHTLDRPHELLADLALSGVYPVLPSFAFFVVGMWVGRRRLGDTAEQVRLLGAGVVLVLAGYVVGGPLGRRLTGGEVFETTGHGNMPAWVVGATGFSLAVLALCLLATARWPRLLSPLAFAGQLALTFYVLHALGLRWWYPDVNDALGYGQELAAALVVLGVFVVAATLWRRRFERGPLEEVLRRAGPTGGGTAR